MSMFDYFAAHASVSCPECGAALGEFQGTDAQCKLIVWQQNARGPRGQRVDDEWRLDQATLRALRLPERFTMETSCPNCRRGLSFTGLCTEGVWTTSVPGVNGEFDRAIPASWVGPDWRQCSSCAEAWSHPDASLHARCPGCRRLTNLAPHARAQDPAALLHAGPLEGAACCSWVRGVEPADLLERLGGTAPFREMTIVEVEEVVAALHELALHDRGGGPGWAEPIGALAAKTSAEWTLMIEPNGWAATRAGDLAALSVGVEIVSVFWNVNGAAEVVIARNGETIAALDEVLGFVGVLDGPRRSLADVEGATPELMADLVEELATLHRWEWEPIVLRWVERYTNSPLPEGWIDQRHPSATFLKRRSS